ncbi:PspC domain-containing protein [Plantactinospora sp. S1510]|uniref:PspC domain-containing protein n=1 Tax=Plantactinospora alkalitolerans TaxID=2789879 RepID=A0ABS0GSH1_9ACTN|nr:PspC domain-containing protein [Plantactinospora alkalitolerans]
MTQIPLHQPLHQPPYKQLRRPTTDRMIAGVASGLGRYFNVDPTLVRVVFAGVAVLTGGLGLLAYPVMWFLMPEEPANAPAWPHPGPTTGPVWPPAWPGSGARGAADATAGPTAGMPHPGTPSDIPPVPPTNAPSVPPTGPPPVIPPTSAP